MVISNGICQKHVKIRFVFYDNPHLPAAHHQKTGIDLLIGFNISETFRIHQNVFIFDLRKKT
jgi:hypothetical protein